MSPETGIPVNPNPNDKDSSQSTRTPGHERVREEIGRLDAILADFSALRMPRGKLTITETRNSEWALREQVMAQTYQPECAGVQV